VTVSDRRTLNLGYAIRYNSAAAVGTKTPDQLPTANRVDTLNLARLRAS
jgi:hypothetical protein